MGKTRIEVEKEKSYIHLVVSCSSAETESKVSEEHFYVCILPHF
jgi:hypothetical protein